MKNHSNTTTLLVVVVTLCIVIVNLLSSVSSSPFFVSAACTLADRNTISPNTTGDLPACIRVGFLAESPNADGTPLSDTQKYWAITLPQRVWKNVKRSLSVRNVEIEEVQTNLSWGQALDFVENGTYDVFVANFWMLASRSKRVDFQIPYLKESWMLLYNTPEIPATSPVVNWADPFTFEVWMIAICIIIAMGVFLWLAELINHGWNGEHHQHILRPDEELKEDPFMMLRDNDLGSYVEAARNSFSHSFGTIFGTYDVFPRSFGGWLVSWAGHFFIFVFFSSYTANLATFLSLRRAAPPRSTNELFTLPVITVPEPEIQTMIREQTPGKSVTTFAGNVGDYATGFLSSGTESAALPELDVKEIILNRCDLSATATDLSIESSFIYRQEDTIYHAKQVLDEAMLQFADFGILSRWVDSGLPTDSCDRDTDLANNGAMGLDELGGAFVVALVLFAVAIFIAIWTWGREKMMHKRVIAKFGENGPHRSDDIDLVGDYVGDCQTSVNDAKRSAASLVELLSERTTEHPDKKEQPLKPKRADWDSSNVKEIKITQADTGVSGELHKSLLMFLHDGIVDPDEEDAADDELSSDDDEREVDRQIEKVHDTNSIAHQISPGERLHKTQLSAKHLAKIRGAVVAVASALALAEDAINRSGRRRYCNLPIETCNSRMGHDEPDRPIEEDSTETPAQFQDRMRRERLHIHQLLEVARGACKSASYCTDAAEVALLSSMMQRGRRRRVLEKWMNRSFRAAAFLTLLIASSARRVANESSYVSVAYLEREHQALEELAELAALTANEVEQMIRSLREDEEDALASPVESRNRKEIHNADLPGFEFSPVHHRAYPTYENRTSSGKQAGAMPDQSDSSGSSSKKDRSQNSRRNNRNNNNSHHHQSVHNLSHRGEDIPLEPVRANPVSYSPHEGTDADGMMATPPLHQPIGNEHDNNNYQYNHSRGGGGGIVGSTSFNPDGGFASHRQQNLNNGDNGMMMSNNNGSTNLGGSGLVKRDSTPSRFRFSPGGGGGQGNNNNNSSTNLANNGSPSNTSSGAGSSSNAKNSFKLAPVKMSDY